MSVIPRRKKVKTIPFNASPHEIDWMKDLPKKKQPVDILLSNSQNVKFSFKKSKESAVSFKQSNGKSQMSIRSIKSEDKRSGKSQDLADKYHVSLAKSIAAPDSNENLHNPADFNADSLFGSNINNRLNISQKDTNLKITRNGGRGSNMNFKHSLSGLSYNSYDPNDLKVTPVASYNPLANLQGSIALPSDSQMLKISAKDLNQMSIGNDEAE